MFFDAHCDTIDRVLKGAYDFATGSGCGQVSLRDLVSIRSCGQVMACCVPHRRYPGCEWKHLLSMIAAIEKIVAASGEMLVLVRTAGDLSAVRKERKIALLIALEGADPCRGDSSKLQMLRDLGITSIMLAWCDNEFSGSAFGRNDPLTEEGARLVECAQDAGIALDVSHLSDRGFWALCRLARRPFLASHSNCRALCPSPRNLDDSMIRALADRGGVMGINLYSGFLDPAFYRAYERPNRERIMYTDLDPEGRATERAQSELSSAPRPCLEWVVRHVRHAMRTGGEACVGLGGDLDGSPNLPRGIDRIGDYGRIIDALEVGGLSSAQIEGVCYANFLRCYSDILPSPDVPTVSLPCSVEES